ncbi:hypothetical protein ACWEWX_34140, partial [Streptomyces asiaticus]
SEASGADRYAFPQDEANLPAPAARSVQRPPGSCPANRPPPGQWIRPGADSYSRRANCSQLPEGCFFLSD